MKNNGEVARKLKRKRGKEKETEKNEPKDAGVARTFWVSTHLLHQICQILPRVFANGKKKGKEKIKCHASQERKALLNKPGILSFNTDIKRGWGQHQEAGALQ